MCWKHLSNNAGRGAQIWGREVPLQLVTLFHCYIRMRELYRTYEIDGFCSLLWGIIAPCFTPQPLLREWFNWHLVYHVVWQILLWRIRVSSSFPRVQGGRNPPQPDTIKKFNFCRVFFSSANKKWWFSFSLHSKQSPLEKTCMLQPLIFCWTIFL